MAAGARGGPAPVGRRASPICTVVLEFLHRLVPVILVSILDDVGALVFAGVALVWGPVLPVGSVPAVVKAVRATAAAR